MKLPKLEIKKGGFMGMYRGNEVYGADYYSPAEVKAYIAVAEQNQAEIVELKAALTLIMRAAEGAKVNCSGDPESPNAMRNAALASIAAVAAQGLGLLKGPKLSEGV